MPKKVLEFFFPLYSMKFFMESWLRETCHTNNLSVYVVKKCTEIQSLDDTDS